MNPFKRTAKPAKPDAVFDAVVDLFDADGYLIDTVATRVDVVNGMAITRWHDKRAAYAVVRSAYEVDKQGLPIT